MRKDLSAYGGPLPSGGSLLRSGDRILQRRSLRNDLPSASLDQQLSQIEAMLADVPSLRRSVLDSVVDETLIRQEAKRRGIVVSPAEVDAAVQEAFGFYPDGTPTPVASPTAGPTNTPAPTLTPTVGPSPTITPTVAPSATPTLVPATSSARPILYATGFQRTDDVDGGSW
jgi:hypothetical protein